MILAVDLGGTSLRIAAGETSRGWRHQRSGPHPEPLTAASVTVTVRDAMQAWGLRTVAGCGISIAGLVHGHRTVRRAENLGWREVGLAEHLEAVLGCPVRIDTDVFCGALFEARHGLARGLGSALYVAIGTGIGHAFLIDGRIWRGHSGAANALGHLAMRREGPTCVCGNVGCLCTLAAGRAEAPDLSELARALGIASTVLEPERVVLSGGALAQPWFDLERLRRLVPGFAYPGAQAAAIVRSRVPDPNLRGAACLLEESP